MKTGKQKPQKPLKVYLCGAHCVGKSTLARWISRKFQLPHIAEVARTELAKLEQVAQAHFAASRKLGEIIRAADQIHD